MQLKTKELDQSQWVCYEFPDGTFYYGEVAYLDDAGTFRLHAGNIHPKDSLEMSTNPKAQLVKHGYGIYVYSKKDNVAVARYQGHWDRDKRNKTGKMHYEDGSVYTGGWKDDQRSDNGSMSWQNGDSYQGSWRRDRFEGPGIFKRKDGGQLKGLYRCNYFIDGEVFRNPFLSEAESEKFLKARKDAVKLKQKIAKIKVGFFKRVPSSNQQEIARVITESNSHNRAPLLFLTTDCLLTFAEFCKQFTGATGQNVYNFDLRKIFTLDHEGRQNYRAEAKKDLAEALSSGGLFVINLDESEAAYNQIFYPDIKEFYDAESLPSHIWSRKEVPRRLTQMEKKEVNGSLSEHPIIMHKDFNVAVWTKHRFNDNKANDKVVLEQLEKRFDSVLPLIKIDYLMLTV